MSTTNNDQSTSTTTEEQLQNRFQEAMQRRKQRRAPSQEQEVEYDVSSENTSADFDAAGISKSDVDVDEGPSGIEEPIDDDMIVTTEADTSSEPLDTAEKNLEKSIMREDERIGSHHRRGRIDASDDYSDYEDAKRTSQKTARSHNKRVPRYEEEDNERQQSNEQYKQEDYSRSNRYYNDVESYDDYNQGSTPSCDWETYRSTSILLPPEKLDANGIPIRPKAILHFVGGTFFGSYPRKFYGSLLEDIALKCDAVIVATPIPLVLPGKGLVNQLEKWMFDEEGGQRKRRSKDESDTNNPLDHSSLAETIQNDFNNAYRDVILDEYCSGYRNEKDVEGFMKNVPIVGIGHSLGARIQAISCSHPRVSKRCLAMGKGNRLVRSGREGMIYLGFANWGASSSIPGLETLDRTVRKREKSKQQEKQDRTRGGGVGRRDDVWDERSSARKSRSEGRRRNGRYNRYEAEDLDLVDVFSDVVSGVANGARQIGEALTPEAEDLEFSPTPNELWDDLSSSGGRYSQSCQNNLIIQFDEDPIDQGSRLTRTLLAAYKAELDLTSLDEVGSSNNEHMHDVKFARLSGGHLTPVTVQEGIAKILPRGAVSLLSSSYDYVLRQLDDERAGKSSQKQQRQVKDVADTIASYIKHIHGED